MLFQTSVSIFKQDTVFVHIQCVRELKGKPSLKAYDYRDMLHMPSASLLAQPTYTCAQSSFHRGEAEPPCCLLFSAVLYVYFQLCRTLYRWAAISQGFRRMGSFWKNALLHRPFHTIAQKHNKHFLCKLHVIVAAHSWTCHMSTSNSRMCNGSDLNTAPSSTACFRTAPIYSV